MTKLQQSERDEAIAKLRETLKPGDTVYTILRQVSRSGMSRIIDLVVNDGSEVRSISWLAARAMQDRMVNGKHYGIKVSECGMDMGFNLVYNLSRVLFRDGFACIGKDCPANDHVNAYSVSRQDQCIVCRATLNGNAGKFTRRNGEHHKYNVCSEHCANDPWMHSDAGYALRHKWL